MIIQKKKFYLITDDLMFKMNLERNQSALIILAKKYIEDLKDLDIKESEIKLLKTENNSGISLKASSYDIKFKALDKCFDFEMQGSKVTYNLEDRFLKYYGDLIVRSYPKGNEYEHDIVYNLWFINFNIYDDNKVIHTFKIKDQDGLELSNCGSITIVEIEKFKNVDYNKDIWDRLFMAKDQDELRKLEGADIIVDKVIKTCYSMNEDPEQWRLFDEDHARRNYGAEKKAIEKEAMEKGLQKGLEKGMKQGIQQGMKQGIQQGIQQGKIDIAKKLKAMGLSINQIIEATGLSKEEIESL